MANTKWTKFRCEQPDPSRSEGKCLALQIRYMKRNEPKVCIRCREENDMQVLY